MADTLASIARELYARGPSEFVAARNARAAEVRRAGDRALAGEVKALPRATAAAWAVCAVARESAEDLDALGELGAELRVAQASADPAGLRALGKRRRELTAAVARAAARLAEEHGVPLSAAAQEQVEATWSAVVIDPVAERAVRSLLLVRALEPGGGVEDALAVPGAVEVPAEEEYEAPAPRRKATAGRPSGGSAPTSESSPSKASARREPTGRTPASEAPASKVAARKAPIDRRSTGPAREPAPARGDTARERRRLERELRARERAADQARQDLESAGEELSRVEAQVLGTASRIEELRRELAEREEELAGLDEDRAAAEEEREDAAELAEAAELAAQEIRERLAELADDRK